MLYSISFSHINELIMQRMCYMLNALWCNGVVLCRSLRQSLSKMSVVFKWRLPQNGLVKETDSTEVKLHTFLEWQTDSWAFQHSSSTSISLWEQNCRNPFGLLIFLGLAMREGRLAVPEIILRKAEISAAALLSLSCSATHALCRAGLFSHPVD